MFPTDNHGNKTFGNSVAPTPWKIRIQISDKQRKPPRVAPSKKYQPSVSTKVPESISPPITLLINALVSTNHESQTASKPVDEIDATLSTPAL